MAIAMHKMLLVCVMRAMLAIPASIVYKTLRAWHAMPPVNGIRLVVAMDVVKGMVHANALFRF